MLLSAGCSAPSSDTAADDGKALLLEEYREGLTSFTRFEKDANSCSASVEYGGEIYEFPYISISISDFTYNGRLYMTVNANEPLGNDLRFCGLYSFSYSQYAVLSDMQTVFEWLGTEDVPAFYFMRFYGGYIYFCKGSNVCRIPVSGGELQIYESSKIHFLHYLDTDGQYIRYCASRSLL